MSIVQGNFTLTCDQCGKPHSFKADDADFDLTGGDSDRGMGEESSYTWEVKFDCNKCNNPISVEYEVWEYPVGAFNYDQVDVKGGKEVNRFDYDFSGSIEYTDNDYPEEDLEDFIPPQRVVTVGDLRRDLELFSDETEIYFEGFVYYRTKKRGNNLVQIELNKKNENE